MTNRFGVLFSCFRFLVFVLVSLFVDLNTGGEDVTQHRRLCIQIFQNILRRISSAAKSSFAHRFVFSSRAPQAHTDKHTQAQKVGERVSKTQSTRSH